MIIKSFIYYCLILRSYHFVTMSTVYGAFAMKDTPRCHQTAQSKCMKYETCAIQIKGAGIDHVTSLGLSSTKWKMGIVLCDASTNSMAFNLHTGNKSSVKLTDILKVHAKGNRCWIDLNKGFTIHLTEHKTKFNIFDCKDKIMAVMTEAAANFQNKRSVGTGFSGTKTSTSPFNTSSESTSPRYTSVKSRGEAGTPSHTMSANDLAEKENKLSSQLMDEVVHQYQKTEETPVYNFYKESSGSSGFDSSGFKIKPLVNQSSTPKPSSLPYVNAVRRPGLLNLTKRVNFQTSWNKKHDSSESNSENKLGFSNLGNTCYMSAILQSLLSLEPFIHDLRHGRSKYGRILGNDSLLHTVTSLCVAQQNRKIPPEARRECLRKVKHSIIKTAKRFSGFAQHDAHEFLSQMLDQLKEETLRLEQSTPSPDSRLTTKPPPASTINPTSHNFEFQIEHKIRCLSCNAEVAKLETFHDLSVDMPRRSGDRVWSLQDAMERFFKPEELEYKCEECEATRAVMSHHFTQLPRIIVLHLKRYNFNAIMAQQRKLGRDIGIPRYVSMHYHCLDETQQPAHLPTDTMLDTSLNTSNTNLNNGTPRRRLDYSFKHSSAWLSKDKPPQSSPAGKDDQFEKVLESSKADSERAADRRKQEEEELERALELSRDQTPRHKQPKGDWVDTADGSFGFDPTSVDNLTEDQQLEMALQQSMQEHNASPAACNQANSDTTAPSHNIADLKDSKINDTANIFGYKDDDDYDLLPELVVESETTYSKVKPPQTKESDSASAKFDCMIEDAKRKKKKVPTATLR